MPDNHPTTLPDPVREEALRLAAAALPPGMEAAQSLLRPLLAGIPLAELAAMAPDELAAMVVSLAGLAQQRLPGEARIRVLPAGRFPHPVAEIVTDDMPFLVDSVLGALAHHGRPLRQVLHPVLPATRAADGSLQAMGEGPLRESLMRISFASTDAATAQTEALIAATLADIRVAVEDFAAMLAELRGAEAGLDGDPRAFLAWLAEDNFVLLGHRRIMIDGSGFRAEEGLGLLRNPAIPVFDALRDLSAVPEAARGGLLERLPITVAKANMRSTVHRTQHADVIAVRIFAEDGRVLGIRLFLGLFAAAAYNRNPRSIPMLAAKVERVLEASGVAPDSHDGRALRNILDTWPRDELFQASEAEILHGARRALDLALMPRTAMVLRPDPFGRFVSAIIWLPRENFDTRLRSQVAELLARAHGGRLSAFYISLGDTPLARVHYIIGTDPMNPARVDAAALESLVCEMARSFQDRVADALLQARGEAQAAATMALWAQAFPPGYRERTTASAALADLALAEQALAQGRPAMAFLRPPGCDARIVQLRLVNIGGPLPLADTLPLFESLDLRAIEEMPHHFTLSDGRRVVLHVFTLEAGAGAAETSFDELLGGLAALLAGEADADGFNRLIPRAELDWRECWLLRAMYRWTKQVGFSFSQGSVEAALCAHPQAARLLVELFHARFDPALPRDPAREESIDAAWKTLLDGVANPDEDRILARLRNVLDAMLRTNFHQRKAYLSFKLESLQAGDMPEPRPWREIFVHSARMEGCHLRAGPVARGGIRWSDRREDFRTEILSLMKAQRLKNVVIVPTGAKGGFILKNPPPAANREAFLAEGIACYRLLVQGMLDITDNLDGTTILPPPAVVRRDGDDPYIVVAADKGTATFSDIANGISADYNFWLGDAFASGGSAGYDHKIMGITARGAWVMIARHFAEMGHDIFAQPFTCAGVGDMSGDVFGNGLLITRQTRLQAAFDHRHIFLDPTPPEAAYDERARLFALPRSSWADYDAGLISAGGGVFPRSAKAITLSPEAQAMLGLAGARHEPTAIMQAILRMQADLLYFGGIGTYIKGSAETQADAGDRANDAIRVNGADIRARVVGEGANLGVTQAGRIEAAQLGANGQGLRINTDALDNSAGVSTSDHEVNIKILLADVEAQGGMTRTQRDALLKSMTDDVASLVLVDNALQSLAISLEVAAGAGALPAQAALMARLEQAKLLDRAQAGLPDDATITLRAAENKGLTRPEAASLLPFAKLWLNETIGQSDLPDDPAFLPLLRAYFPPALRENFAAHIETHRLRRELVAMALANQVANRLGCAGLGRLTAEATPAAAARAIWLAGALLGLEDAAIEADAAARPASERLSTQTALRSLLENAAQSLLAETAPLGETLAALSPGLPALLDGRAGADALAAAPKLAAAPAILRLALTSGASAQAAAEAWDGVAKRFHLPALRAAANMARVSGSFGNRARAALLADIASVQARLAAALLAGQPEAPGADMAARLVEEAAGVPDLAAVTVAARALAALA